MVQQSIEVRGLADIQARIARLGQRLGAGELRRPSVSIAKSLVNSNKARLARGVDVHGRPLRSAAARRRGVVPLGGAKGVFYRSVFASAFTSGDGVDLYSNFIGADVAYKGKEITPKKAKYLTVPLDAKGGESEGDGGAGLSLVANRTGRRARQYEGTFFLETDGSLFLVQRDKRVKGDNARKLRFLFVLIRRMRYPQNEWLGASNDDLTKAAETYGQHLDTFAA